MRPMLICGGQIFFFFPFCGVTERGVVAKRHFYGAEETTLEAYAIICLNEYFIVNEKYFSSRHNLVFI
jgi:hypothetical protein